MDLGDKVLFSRQFDFIQRRGRGTEPAAGVNDFIGGDTVEPGAEGGFFRIIGGKRPQNRQKDALGQIHCVLLVSGLAIGKDINLIVVPLNQPLRRLTGTAALDIPYPLAFMFHSLTAFHY